MQATLYINNKLRTIDFSKPLDISIPLTDTSKNPMAWYLDTPVIRPVQLDDWVGKVSKGASVNFNSIQFNPHAHGTHTEGVGHISKEFHSVQKSLKNFFFTAEVISVTPENFGEDLVIPSTQIKGLVKDKNTEAVVIRTLPNTSQKKSKKYSHTNWPYVHENAATYLRELGVKHLLIDLPSVDKEKDGGKLLAHRAFWKYPEAPRFDATITEFIYVPNHIKDGSYILNLQTANFVNDATPSRPVLYKLL